MSHLKHTKNKNSCTSKIQTDFNITSNESKNLRDQVLTPKKIVVVKRVKVHNKSDNRTSDLNSQCIDELKSDDTKALFPPSSRIQETNIENEDAGNSIFLSLISPPEFPINIV